MTAWNIVSSERKKSRCFLIYSPVPKVTAGYHFPFASKSFACPSAVSLGYPPAGLSSNSVWAFEGRTLSFISLFPVPSPVPGTQRPFDADWMEWDSMVCTAYAGKIIIAKSLLDEGIRGSPSSPRAGLPCPLPAYLCSSSTLPRERWNGLSPWWV